MKLNTVALSLWALISCPNSVPVVTAQNTMVKMCLFYKNPSGHARSDPIINQQCASGHVHTFYGPQNFHPQTSYEDIRDTPGRFSSTPYIENQSLYWHPSIYEVVQNGDGSKTFTRIDAVETSPYYRWDNSVLPRTEAFPPGFQMIAHSNDIGAEGQMLTECCNIIGDEEESCSEWDRLHFPSNRKCDFLGIALAMPTCWDGQSLGDNNDHKSHMSYTTDGSVNGPCPGGFNRRLPEVQLFLRINNYDSRSKSYQLSDGFTDVFHVDFFNGWQEGKLQEIIDNCPLDNSQDYGYNPPCYCTPDGEVESNFITVNTQIAGPVCDVDVRELIIDEVIDVTSQLPTGECQGSPLIPRSWTELSEGLLDCAATPGGSPTSGPTTAPTPIPSHIRTPGPSPFPTSVQSRRPTKAPTQSPTARPTPRKMEDPTPLPYPPIDNNCIGDECYDCCDEIFVDCEGPKDDACNLAFEQCEFACESEDDVDECIYEVCETNFEQCHDNVMNICIPIFEECESKCED